MDTNENKNLPERPDVNSSERSGRAFAGIIVVTVGALLLARESGADIPRWMISWPMLLIVIGLYVGFKNSFKNWAWMIPTGIGVLFLSDRFMDDFSIFQYFWPLMIIVIGLILIFRPKRKKGVFRNWDNTSESNTSEDLIDATTVFGAIKKNIISKNFRGGEATSVFGGVEINLGQADLNGRAELELTHIFGGAKLVVPSDWTIKTDEVVCIFGGLDDKRKLAGIPADPNKVLVLNGTVIFGGIDIKSY